MAQVTLRSRPNLLDLVLLARLAAVVTLVIGTAEVLHSALPELAIDLSARGAPGPQGFLGDMLEFIRARAAALSISEIGQLTGYSMAGAVAITVLYAPAGKIARAINIRSSR